MADHNLLSRENAALKQQLMQLSRSLEEAEARYDAVFNTALSLMSVCTTEGVILDVNRAALQAIGLPIEAFVGQHLWESPWFSQNPPEAAKIEDALRRRRGQHVEYDSKIRSRKGEWRVYRFTLRPYRSYVGAEARFLVLEVVDVTDPDTPALATSDAEAPPRSTCRTAAS
jgi:PAS domain S-box-containing protein